MSPALSEAASSESGSLAPRKARSASGGDQRVRGGERDAADALGLARDRRDEADQRSATIEYRSAAGALVHRGGHDRPRVAAGKRGRACRNARPGKSKNDEILRWRAEPGRSAVRGEISGEHRQARCGVGALDPHRLAGDSRMRAVVCFERGQRLTGRHDKRGRGRLRNSRRGGRAGSAPRALRRLLPAPRRTPGNGSNELAMAIAMRSRVGGLRRRIGESEAADLWARVRVLVEAGVELDRSVLSRDDKEGVRLDRLIGNLAGRRRRGQTRIEGAQVGVGVRGEVEPRAWKRTQQFQRRADPGAGLGVAHDLESSRLAGLLSGGEQGLELRRATAPRRSAL